MCVFLGKSTNGTNDRYKPVSLPELLPLWQLHEALDLVGSVLAVVAAVAAVALRDALAVAPVPVVDRQDL